MTAPRTVKANARVRETAFREAEQLPLIRETDLQKTQKVEDKTTSQHLATEGHYNNYAQGPNEGQKERRKEADHTMEPYMGSWARLQ